MVLLPSRFLKEVDTTILRLHEMENVDFEIGSESDHVVLDWNREKAPGLTIGCIETSREVFTFEYYDSNRKRSKCHTTTTTTRKLEEKLSDGTTATPESRAILERPLEPDVKAHELNDKQLRQKFLSFYPSMSEQCRMQIRDLAASEKGSDDDNEEEEEKDEEEEQELVTKSELEKRLVQFKKEHDEEYEDGGGVDTVQLVKGLLLESLTPEWKASVKKGICPQCEKKTENFANLLKHYRKAHAVEEHENG